MQFEFELNQNERARLLSALKTLRLGDSMAMVRETLGNPNEEKIIKTKEGNFVSYRMQYWIKQVRLNSGNRNNQRIGLYFDINKKLKEIGYSCIEPVSGVIITEKSMPEMQIFYTIPPA